MTPLFYLIVYLYIYSLILDLIVLRVCRWLMWINQLSYRYMLGQLYNKFIHIFAMCYKMYKNILCQWLTFASNWVVNQQVILLGFNRRTSETVRDITFIFDNYLNQNVKHKKINKRFLEWFIGFTEGKGSFLTSGAPSRRRPGVVKNNKVYFDISINIKDIQVIYYIKKELGFGKVLIRDLGQDNSHSSSSDSRIVSFYITSALRSRPKVMDLGRRIDNFSRLVYLFNGNLCTVNKKQEFQTWLNAFNNQYSKEILFIDRIMKASPRDPQGPRGPPREV